MQSVSAHIVGYLYGPSEIDNPMATADIRWISAADGGRKSGPPTAPVYMATAVFKLGREAETMPGWPATADQLSILVQRIEELRNGIDKAKIGFLVQELARPHLRVNAELLIMEGPKVVAEAVISELLA